MIRNKLTTKKILIGPALGAILGAGILIGCTGDTEGREGREANHVEASQSSSERGEGSGGEHGSGGEGGGEHGSGGESGNESGAGGGEEGSGAMLAPDQTFDMVRGGARLVLSYDAAGNAFTGSVENTTSNVLTRVRIEVHLSNGTELGPTTPVDMAPGQVMRVDIPATAAPFTGWTPHAEVGSGEGGGEGGGEGSESAVSQARPPEKGAAAPGEAGSGEGSLTRSNPTEGAGGKRAPPRSSQDGRHAAAQIYGTLFETTPDANWSGLYFERAGSSAEASTTAIRAPWPHLAPTGSST